MKAFKLGMLLALGLIVLLGVQSTSYALPAPPWVGLRISDGGFLPAITVFDESLPGTTAGMTDLFAGTGIVNWNSSEITAANAATYGGVVGQYGGWSISIQSVTTYPVTGDQVSPQIDLNVALTPKTADALAHPLQLDASAIDYILQGSVATFTFSSAPSLGAGTTLVTSAYYDNTNGFFTPGALIGSLTFNASGSQSITNTFTGQSNTTYSLDVRDVYTATALGNVSSSDSVVTGKVPEPISLILLGGGLAGAGLYRRLRKPKG